MDSFSTYRNLAAVIVNYKIIQNKNTLRSRHVQVHTVDPKRGTHTGKKFCSSKWLSNIIICAKIQGREPAAKELSFLTVSSFLMAWRSRSLEKAQRQEDRITAAASKSAVGTHGRQAYRQRCLL